MPDPSGEAAVPPVQIQQAAGTLKPVLKKLIAGNPFYLASAGLLLYGVNQLTSDRNFIGAEFAMLRFNFCALLLYEVMLVCTAILLMRRNIWYDAMLLFGLTNLFVIVPFSLISRAVFLSPGLALTMSIVGVVLAGGKLWAFKKYVPGLNLPRRLLAFGALLLLVNAYSPLVFKAIANDLDRVKLYLNFVWMFILPAMAALGLFLPRKIDSSSTPGGKKWLPTALFFSWLIVTACHFGGIGYSTSYVWNISLLVPVVWVAAWTICFGIQDFVVQLKRPIQQGLLLLPLLAPLLAIDSEQILPVFAGLNLVAYGFIFATDKHRNLFTLTQLLAAIAIFCGNLPAAWIAHIVPGVMRTEWMFLTTFVCFFWLIFRSRDPRIAMISAMCLVGFCMAFAPDFARHATQLAFVSLLAHSLRWNDQAHRGASWLRGLTAVLWVWVSCSWLFGEGPPARVLVDSAAAILLVISLFHILLLQNRKHQIVPLCAVVILLSEPFVSFKNWVAQQPSGIIAVIGSFALFALGSIAAFSKPRWWRSNS